MDGGDKVEKVLGPRRERERGEILTLSPKRTVAFLCKQQKMTDVFMIVYMNKKHQTHVDRFVVRSSFECF